MKSRLNKEKFLHTLNVLLHGSEESFFYFNEEILKVTKCYENLRDPYLGHV